MTDLATFGEAMLRLSPPGHQRLEATETLEVHVAGAESNVAAAAARIGTEATWISTLPDSPLGRRVTAFLHGVGVETDVVWSEKGRQGTYFVEFGGEPRGTRVLYDRAHSAIAEASDAELPTHRVEDAEMFATSGITPALADHLAATTERLLETAQAANTTTVLDLNYRSKLWEPGEARAVLTRLFPHVDVLVAAERDVSRILDHRADQLGVVRNLANEWEFDRVILTRGERGAVALSEGEVFDQPAFETETLDPIGSGDAFLGVLLGRLLDGASMPSALEWGAAAAALKRTIPGDIAVITREEVEQVIETETSSIQR